MALALVTVMSRGAEATELERPVVIQLRDYAEVPPFTLLRAQLEAGRIFEMAGIRLIWRAFEVTSYYPASAVRLRILILSDEILREYSRRETVRPDTLGMANPARACAFIFYPHLLSHLHRSEAEFPTLLGRVLAHEIGHLLLLDGGHSKTGIMRARLDHRIAGQRFTAAQALAMRSALSAAPELQASR
jgi:hypothetical protein